MLVHVRLNVQNALFGVYAARNQKRGERQRSLAKLGRVLPNGYRVHIRNRKITVVVVLKPYPVLHGAQIVAYG